MTGGLFLFLKNVWDNWDLGFRSMESQFMRPSRGSIKTIPLLRICGKSRDTNLCISVTVRTVTVHIIWFIRYTQKENVVYAIVLDWPQSNQIVLGAVETKTVSGIQLIGVKGNVHFTEATVGGTLVTLPQLNPESLQWAYVLKISSK